MFSAELLKQLWIQKQTNQFKNINLYSNTFQTPNQVGLAVDVGCGSGQGTVLLAPYFTKVVGTDVSPAQLEMALTNNKNPPNVSYR